MAPAPHDPLAGILPQLQTSSSDLGDSLRRLEARVAAISRCELTTAKRAALIASTEDLARRLVLMQASIESCLDMIDTLRRDHAAVEPVAR